VRKEARSASAAEGTKHLANLQTKVDELGYCSPTPCRGRNTSSHPSRTCRQCGNVTAVAGCNQGRDQGSFPKVVRVDFEQGTNCVRPALQGATKWPDTYPGFGLKLTNHVLVRRLPEWRGHGLLAVWNKPRSDREKKCEQEKWFDSCDKDHPTLAATFSLARTYLARCFRRGFLCPTLLFLCPTLLLLGSSLAIWQPRFLGSDRGHNEDVELLFMFNYEPFARRDMQSCRYLRARKTLQVHQTYPMILTPSIL
jgi:hypothetical protein